MPATYVAHIVHWNGRDCCDLKAYLSSKQTCVANAIIFGGVAATTTPTVARARAEQHRDAGELRLLEFAHILSIARSHTESSDRHTCFASARSNTLGPTHQILSVGHTQSLLFSICQRFTLPHQTPVTSLGSYNAFVSLVACGLCVGCQPGGGNFYATTAFCLSKRWTLPLPSSNDKR
eukprot:6189378-Pleurochrysis_carterae.AAC.2